MWMHRLVGFGSAAFGAALLIGQIVLLNGTWGHRALMVTIGLPGSAILTSLGACSLVLGLSFALAPVQTIHHARRLLQGRRRWN